MTGASSMAFVVNLNMHVGCGPVITVSTPTQVGTRSCMTTSALCCKSPPPGYPSYPGDPGEPQQSPPPANPPPYDYPPFFPGTPGDY